MGKVVVLYSGTGMYCSRCGSEIVYDEQGLRYWCGACASPRGPYDPPPYDEEDEG